MNYTIDFNHETLKAKVISSQNNQLIDNFINCANQYFYIIDLVNKKDLEEFECCYLEIFRDPREYFQ
jgi:hypothetical protein